MRILYLTCLICLLTSSSVRPFPEVPYPSNITVNEQTIPLLPFPPFLPRTRKDTATNHMNLSATQTTSLAHTSRIRNSSLMRLNHQTAASKRTRQTDKQMNYKRRGWWNRYIYYLIFPSLLLGGSGWVCDIQPSSYLTLLEQKQDSQRSNATTTFCYHTYLTPPLPPLSLSLLFSPLLISTHPPKPYPSPLHFLNPPLYDGNFKKKKKKLET